MNNTGKKLSVTVVLAVTLPSLQNLMISLHYNHHKWYTPHYISLNNNCNWTKAMRTDNCSSNLIYNPMVSNSETSSAENKTFMHLSLPIWTTCLSFSKWEAESGTLFLCGFFWGNLSNCASSIFSIMPESILINVFGMSWILVWVNNDQIYMIFE